MFRTYLFMFKKFSFVHFICVYFLIILYVYIHIYVYIFVYYLFIDFVTLYSHRWKNWFVLLIFGVQLWKVVAEKLAPFDKFPAGQAEWKSQTGVG